MNINESDDESIEMTPEILAQWAIWEKEAEDEQALYNSHSPNVQRAIDEISYIINSSDNTKTSINKLITILINARKNDYINRNLDHDPNITEDEFIEAMDYSNYKPITIHSKKYFDCKIDPKVISVLTRYEDRFIFKTSFDEFFDKNIVKCAICKEKYIVDNFYYNIDIGCKNRKYKWHQSVGVVVGVLE